MPGGNHFYSEVVLLLLGALEYCRSCQTCHTDSAPDDTSSSGVNQVQFTRWFPCQLRCNSLERLWLLLRLALALFSSLHLLSTYTGVEMGRYATVCWQAFGLTLALLALALFPPIVPIISTRQIPGQNHLKTMFLFITLTLKINYYY